MPVLPVPATSFHVHGSRFTSFVGASSGSAELRAWKLEVPANTSGAEHRPTREEILLVLSGPLHVTLDGVTAEAAEGDVIHVAAGSSLRLDTGRAAASAWVTTTPGLEAVLEDGTRLSPPWAR